ncbi:MAG: cysteine desulfurase family protein, partial [Sphingomonadales bacterium]
MTGAIYLDHMASTPLDPRVLEEMRPWLAEQSAANPHSAHRAGWLGAEAIERAKDRIARLIGAGPGQIVFTSGATEANNLALFGACGNGIDRVIVSAIEHPSVLECLPALKRRGIPGTVVGVDSNGLIDLDKLEATLQAPGRALVSIMAANNEVGVLEPIAEIAQLCAAHDALFHTDAAQLFAAGPVDVQSLGIDLLSLSGHKLYGPMGIGALYVRDGMTLAPLMYGGSQQQGRRPGTLPTALCVGLGKAADLARLDGARDAERLARLRLRLWEGLQNLAPDLKCNGSMEHGLAGCLNVTFPGVDAADMVMGLADLALSTGAACGSGG